MISDLPRMLNRKTGRASSWDTSGRNQDLWIIPPGESVVLADIRGPAQITHIWGQQLNHYRECLLKITYDNAPHPSVLVPWGDFFCLGHGMVNSFESALFSATTFFPHEFNRPAAVNSYVPMPFAERAVVELINQSNQAHRQYFYIDYETLDTFPEDFAYFHAEFRRANPTEGWGPDIHVNTPDTDAVNKERDAWNDNYVILDTQGHGQYIGCNLSITNFKDTWWGEGDDMIWVDGYKWPPDLHGTGTEDYFGHGGGMQPNTFLRNGSSIYEGYTIDSPEIELWRGNGGYQTSYVFHIENPVRFTREIKVTIEHGHANHQSNEMSSVAYWYAAQPARVVDVPPVNKRLPILRDNQNHWLHNADQESPGPAATVNEERQEKKTRWADRW